MTKVKFDFVINTMSNFDKVEDYINHTLNICGYKFNLELFLFIEIICLFIKEIKAKSTK